jgi:hypothetical protein
VHVENCFAVGDLDDIKFSRIESQRESLRYSISECFGLSDAALIFDGKFNVKSKLDC